MSSRRGFPLRASKIDAIAVLYCAPFDQCIEPFGNPEAGIAQLVEHHVANVDVASSSLVSRSKFPSKTRQLAPWRKAQADREAGCALLESPICDFKSVLFFGVQTVLENETCLGAISTDTLFVRIVTRPVNSSETSDGCHRWLTRERTGSDYYGR